jgi:hypothetical protein
MDNILYTVLLLREWGETVTLELGILKSWEKKRIS